MMDFLFYCVRYIIEAGVGLLALIGFSAIVVGLRDRERYREQKQFNSTYR
jgi:hypothetical protein